MISIHSRKFFVLRSALWFTVLALVAFLVSCGGGTSGTGVEVVGRLVVVDSKAPISSVEVTLLDTGEKALSDDDGEFFFVAPPVGVLSFDFSGSAVRDTVSAQINAETDRVLITFGVNDQTRRVEEVDVKDQSQPRPTRSPTATASKPPPTQAPSPNGVGVKGFTLTCRGKTAAARRVRCTFALTLFPGVGRHPAGRIVELAVLSARSGAVREVFTFVTQTHGFIREEFETVLPSCFVARYIEGGAEEYRHPKVCIEQTGP